MAFGACLLARSLARSQYRFWLTTIVGSSILLTLGSASYFGPDPDALKTRTELARLIEAGPTKSMPTGYVRARAGGR
jgi:hypothetical protein